MVDALSDGGEDRLEWTLNDASSILGVTLTEMRNAM